MSIVVRTIHGRQYAYSAHREGKRMVQTYLGPLDRPRVQTAVDVWTRGREIPAHVRRLFWETDADALNPARHAGVIIERVLELGDLQDVRWLQERYPGTLIEHVLALARGLSPRSRTFWNLWFHQGAPDVS